MIDKIKNKLEEEGKFWIGFVGDSITSCEWVHPNWREIVEYVIKEELQKLMSGWKVPSWGVRCFNCGYDGATTKDVVEKIGEIEGLHPDLVILMIGGNDSVLRVSKEEHKKNIREIAASLAAKSIDLIYSTDSKPWNEKLTKTYGEYVEVDKKLKIENTQFINLFEEFDNFPTERIFTFKSEGIEVVGIKKGDLDFLHPNQLGNAYIAKIILKEVFGIDFDPEKYIKTTLSGEKYPQY
jgi:NAD kinase